jgi:hypothetical protein
VYRDFLSRIKKCEQNDYKNQWSHRFGFGWITINRNNINSFTNFFLPFI